VAANLIAGALQKHRWIAYVGLAIILYVALEMIWRGAMEVKPAMATTLASGTPGLTLSLPNPITPP
jgi:predicted tellurium resistance membrane protein TerC